MCLVKAARTSSGRTSARLRNKGVELSINSLNINARNFKWRTTFNISSNRNKIISLGNVTAIPVNINDGTINEVSRLKVGSPIGGAWGYVWDGIYQKQTSTSTETSSPVWLASRALR